VGADADRGPERDLSEPASCEQAHEEERHGCEEAVRVGTGGALGEAVPAQVLGDVVDVDRRARHQRRHHEGGGGS